MVSLVAKLLDGKKIASEIKCRIKREVKAIARKSGKTPGLAAVLVGADPASRLYVEKKEGACSETGIRSRVIRLPDSASEKKLLQQVRALNQDASVHGILVQLPLPKHIDKNKVLQQIAVEKDVDGFHPLNVGWLALGSPRMIPATPKGVMRLIQETGASLEGMEAVVVGKGDATGKPIALLLANAGATVTVCDKRTRDLASHTRAADLLVSATGVPLLIKAEHVKEGAIVIDVGIARLPNGAIVGDVDFKAVWGKAGWLTPVPGGVGPMTVAALLENTLQAFKEIEGIS